ncbi:MAG: hypothetical protein PW788_13190 [Micavibrio sp.]|nr:hypothetical protein [Micavibrio sp.]
MSTPKKDFTAATTETEWKGGHCGVHDAGTFVAKTQAEWVQLWDATFSNTFPAPAAPQLPEGKIAVGIFTGQRSAPSEISVTGVEAVNGGLNVTWQQESFRSMLAVMHEPFLLKFIDAAAGDVTFTKQQPQPKTPAIDLKTLKRMDGKPQ